QVTERYLAEKKLQYTHQEPDPEKLQGKIDRLEERSDKQLATLSRIKRFKPGQSVRMTAKNGRVFYGVISNVRKRGKALDTFGDLSVPVKENVAIPSRWEVVIAIADEQRQIALPLSKLNPAVETPDSFTVAPARMYSNNVDIYQLFDRRQMGDREVRTILKGNLLRAADTPYQSQGKLILASMSNGQMEPVMLMDKGFNPQQEMEAAPVILPDAEKVEAFIAATNGTGIVKTTDEAITLKQNVAGEFFILTGKTRKDIYLDPNLLAAVGSEFTSVSDRMQAKFEQGRLEDVVGYLIKGKGNRLAAFTEQSTARELLGLTIPELKWADTVESVVGREGLPPIVDVTDLNAVRQQLTEAFNASTDERTMPFELPDQPLEALPEQQPEAELLEAQTVEGETSDVEAAPDEALRVVPTEATEVAPVAEAQAEVQPIVQKPEAHRLRFTAERQVSQFLHEAGLAQKVMGSESFHLRIENEPYLPLVVEAHMVVNDRLLYLTHYREQNGDLIHDGEMVFGIKESGHLRFQEVAVQNALTGGEIRGYDREFAAMFSKNILEQGFAFEARKQQEASLDKPLSPSLPLPEQVKSEGTDNSLENNQEPEGFLEPASESADSELASIYGNASLEDIDYVEQLIEDYDGDTDALFDAIIAEKMQLPSESKRTEPIPDLLASEEAASQSETPRKIERSQPASHPPVDRQIATAQSVANQPFGNIQAPQTTVTRALVEKGERAAKYIGNAELAQTITAALTAQDEAQPNLTITDSLRAQVENTIALARNQQQTKWASEILPIAKKLLKNAEQAGLTRSVRTDQGQITSLEGKNYSVRCRINNAKEELKVLCHQTNGLIYAVDGVPQKSQGLSKADGVRLAKHANMKPAQLKQAIRQKARAGVEV
ncbi:MAG: hypothetical protein WBA76_09605, partial [Phormidesmis sp.]